MAKLPITIKEAKLVKGIAEGKTRQAAALAAYDTTDPATASAIASETLKKPNVQEALHMELERQGITLEKIVKPVANALNSEEVELQLKGHDRAMKIIAPRNGEGATVNINFNQHVQEQRDKYGL